MPQRRKDPNTARITPFGRDCLNDLVTRLATTTPVFPVKDSDLVGGLIWAALRSPPEAVKAVVGTYRDLEMELAAVEAVAAFLRAYA
jgi:hypothetical protein